MRPFLLQLLATLLLCSVVRAESDNRLTIPATIAHQRAQLAFDTGWSGETIFLFADGVSRLKLKVESHLAGASVNGSDSVVGETVAYPTSVLGVELTLKFAVLPQDQTQPSGCDGVLPYWTVAQDIWSMDLARGIFAASVTRQKDFDHLAQAKIEPNENQMLTIDVPNSDGAPVKVAIDTGQDTGVGLMPAAWKEWNARHADAPSTVNAGFLPGVGVEATFEKWADRLKLGNVEIQGVPVRAATPGEQANCAPGTYCIVGLYALSRLQLVLDGKNLQAEIGPTPAAPPAYKQNRLGAVFIPRPNEGDDLIAVVAPGSPAAKAGIADGDVLLRINDLEVLHWKTTPRILPLSRFWEEKAGTALSLVVRHGPSTETRTVVLADILGGNS